MYLLSKIKSFFEEIKLFFLGFFSVSLDDASPDNEYYNYPGEDDPQQDLYEPRDYTFRHPSSADGDNDSD